MRQSNAGDEGGVVTDSANLERFDQEELQHLVDLLQADQIAVAEHDRLAEILRSIPSARRWYIQYMLVCGGLRDLMGSKLLQPMLIDLECDLEGFDCDPLSFSKINVKNEALVLPALVLMDEPHEEPAIPPASFQPNIEVKRPLPRFGWKGMAAAVAFVLVGLAAAFWMLHQRGGNTITASLVNQIDAQWAQGSQRQNHALTDGAPVRDSEYSLQSGLVKLQFKGGVQVIVEGPAQFTPIADGRIVLTAGKLSALVGPDGRGFVVQTPHADITDLGTEFAVGVGDNGRADVYVIRGQVSLQTRPDSGAAPPPQNLLEGDARHVDSTGTIAPLGGNPVSFVTVGEFDARQGDVQNSGYDRWIAASYALRRDPSLLAYYTFEPDSQSPERLRNLSAIGTALDGTIEVAAPGVYPTTAGRWPQKHALSLGPGRARRVVIADPQSVLNFTRGEDVSAPFTILCWIKTSPTDGAILSRGNPWSEQFALYVLRNRFYGVARDRIDVTRNNGTGAGSSIAPDDQWHQVGLVFDPESHTYVLYVDGSSAATGQLKTRRLLDQNEPVIIGGERSIDNLQPLNGIIDELAIFRRAFSPVDVRKIYESGVTDREQ